MILDLPRPRVRHAVALVALAAMAMPAMSAAPAPTARLPTPVEKALARARVPRDAVSMLVVEAGGKQPPRLSWRADVPMNPASVMKLVTTWSALDVLGRDFTWKTTVLLDGKLTGGLLNGNMVVQGGGDPKLVVERLQALLTQVQAGGARAIRGDIVLDRSAFSVPATDPGEFDGEPLRPYNARPDALLINFKSIVMTFTPDLPSGRALVRYEPPLAGVQMGTSVPLVRVARCGDWRSELRASVENPVNIEFLGTYSSACGERVWPSAYADPASFAARAIEGSWRQLGGLLTGSVRDATPAELAMLRSSGTLSGEKAAVRFDYQSPPLLDVVRDVNKYSNNIMAQHLFLTLGLQAGLGQPKAGTLESARAALAAWWRKSLPGSTPPVMDNGSGLSRNERISAASLSALLQHAARSPLAADLADSLPVAGVDGTLRERGKNLAGQAFLKTGSLRDVTAIAGYANGNSGARYIVVALVNHPNAGAARPALDALVEWAVKEGAR
ncbi:MAG: D-alanyl-D-alanine carboxypeptidase/D-alanyl-D-alanine-endopeptidase [Polaromonas sp.]|uniref:D-alanyl-D-alanine carboxypeptidase/D-alanyl-D-alanine endopeptidase n=1 Tax=Polaromonas sp. TaxID=1869339 RepID=UPI0032664B2D